MALTYDEIDAHVRSKYIPILQDAFYYSTPLLTQLMEKTRVTYDSGADVRVPVMYGDLNSGWYSGYDEFNVDPKETTTLAVFDWTQLYVNVTISGTDELKVEGDEKILSLVETKMDNASKTFMKKFDQACFTSQGAKAIVPVSTALATTGTYGGIDKSTYSWWRGTVNSTGGAFSMDMLETAYGACSDGPIQPDLIITTQAIYDKIWLRVQPTQRSNLENTPGMAKIGFSGISFNKATIVVDKYCPSGYIFILNTDFWKLIVHKKRNMMWTDKKIPINQDVWTRQLLWAGILACLGPRWNGYISNVS